MLIPKTDHRPLMDRHCSSCVVDVIKCQRWIIKLRSALLNFVAVVVAILRSSNWFNAVLIDVRTAANRRNGNNSPEPMFSAAAIGNTEANFRQPRVKLSLLVVGRPEAWNKEPSSFSVLFSVQNCWHVRAKRQRERLFQRLPNCSLKAGIVRGSNHEKRGFKTFAQGGKRGTSKWLFDDQGWWRRLESTTTATISSYDRETSWWW